MLFAFLSLHPLSQRAVCPQEGVGQKECKHADEECCHKDERIIEDRVFRPVAFFGVRIKFCETLRRRGMTFPARRQDVFLRQGRLRIADPEDAVGAMAVGALCHRRISEFGHLAVVRFPVGFDLFRMAVTALSDKGQLPLVIAGWRSQVFKMTVEARCRPAVFPAHKLLSMDAVAVCFELLRMAGRAEFRNILPVGR